MGLEYLGHELIGNAGAVVDDPDGDRPGLLRRLDVDPNGLPRQTLGDLRARIETEWSNQALRLTFKGDVLYDDYESETEAELRELAIQASPRSSITPMSSRCTTTASFQVVNPIWPWSCFRAGPWTRSSST